MKSGSAVIHLGKIAGLASQLAVHVVNDSTNGDNSEKCARRARLWAHLKDEVRELEKKITADGRLYTGEAN